jgi:protein gp37
MSDLFHKDIPVTYIRKVFKVMNETPQHTYQILTKRAVILAKYDSMGILTWTPNIWMGVTVENNKVIDRIEYLSNSGAYIKFISFEPLISQLPKINFTNINWAIVGGESGPKARPIKKEWVLDIREQCHIADVDFFFKQWGKPEFNSNPNDPTINKNHPDYAKGGCNINGKIYKNIPKKQIVPFELA